MNIQYIKYGILLATSCLFTISMLAKETVSFTYGGAKGKKHGGKVVVEYEIKSGQRVIDLQKTRNTIDLNLYNKPVYLNVKLSDVQVGLNKAGDKLRHDDHYKIFYIEVQADETNQDVLQAIENPVKVAAPVSHYANSEVALQYLVNLAGQSTKKITISTSLLTVDGVYNRRWAAKMLSKTITIIPKADPCYNINCKDNEFCENGNCLPIDLCEKVKCNRNEYCKNGKCIRTPIDPCLKCKRNEVCVKGVCQTIKEIIESKEKQQTDGKAPISEAAKLWQLIQTDSLNTIDSVNLNNCKRYLEICREQKTEDCNKVDQVFCKQMELVSKAVLIELEQVYLNEFPNGACRDNVLANIKNRIPKITPGLAQLQVNARALLVHKVAGGATPYFVDFYKHNENNTLRVKRERFTAPHFLLDFKNTKLEGSYEVQVVDNVGNAITEKEKIDIPATVEVSKSVMVLSILLVFIGLSTLYKKYVHF